jgi:hypothetical protein
MREGFKEDAREEKINAKENSDGRNQIAGHSKELEKGTSEIREAERLDQVNRKVVLFRIGDHVYGTVTGSPEGIAEFIEKLGGILNSKNNR